jgi:3-hydroxypropanoate dehydrogenase
MSDRIGQMALDRIFYEARTFNNWQDRSVSTMQIRELVNLMKWAPTSANCSPARLVIVVSDEAKEKLIPLAMAANQDKIRSAPACAIIGHDLAFADHLPTLFPHTDAKAWFEGNEELTEITAFRNGTLQGAYFIMAARALGLDTGPMSGFDNAAVDEAFFADTKIKSNFLCTFGYGDAEGMFDRSPRFSFEEFASIV